MRLSNLIKSVPTNFTLNYARHMSYARADEYIDPELTVVGENQCYFGYDALTFFIVNNSQQGLILTNAISAQYNIIKWDITGAVLGDDTLVGSLMMGIGESSTFIDRLKNGTAALVIDASACNNVDGICKICQNIKQLSMYPCHIYVAITNKVLENVIKNMGNQMPNYNRMKIAGSWVNVALDTTTESVLLKAFDNICTDEDDTSDEIIKRIKKHLYAFSDNALGAMEAKMREHEYYNKKPSLLDLYQRISKERTARNI